METAYPKKMVSNIPVLASVCLTGSVYHTNNSVSQKIFVKFMSRAVTELVQYRKITKKSSPVGRKCRQFHVDVEFRYYLISIGPTAPIAVFRSVKKHTK